MGGIIGTKVVRYDIFGQDVLIANKMESNGMAGAVCISENTYNLIKKNFLVDTFEFKEHHPCEIGTIGKTIKSYIVEQIFNEEMMMGETSEEYSEGAASNDDDQDQSNSINNYNS